MVRQWVQESWNRLLPALEGLGLAQEEEIARICADEIEAWLARTDIQKSSLRVPMTDTRNLLKERLPVNDETKWLDTKDRKYYHVALKYFKFSEEEYEEMNAPSEEAFERRLQEQQEISNPDAIVARARQLLRAERPEDIAVGLAVVTGRRLTEILKVGAIYAKTQYSVMFEGQLKRRDIRLPAYEIPTLVFADEVLSAWIRLREFLDLSEIDVVDVAPKYSGLLGENADRHFADLIPTPEGKHLHMHLMRGIYARIAVYWFCPDSMVDLVYVSAILGHYKRGKVTEIDRRNYAATAHYYDYRLMSVGQGVRLAEPGVEVLAIFQKGGKAMSGTDQANGEQQASVISPKKANSTGFSMLRPKVATADRFKALLAQRDLRKEDETLQYLLDTEVVAQQLLNRLEPYRERFQTQTSIGTLVALISAYEASASLSNVEEISALVSDVAKTEEKPVEYLQELVRKDRYIKEALRNRHSNVDYASLTLAELGKIKTPEAAVERYRRAVDAIMAYNIAQSEPLRRWYINAVEVNHLVGGQNKSIQAYLQTRKDEIDQHHESLSLTARFNRKPGSITDDIKDIA